MHFLDGTELTRDQLTSLLELLVSNATRKG
jgi:hypothetical protein